MPQLSLFEPGPDFVAPLKAIHPSSHVVEVAARLPTKLRLGAMSWTYPGWIGLLYASDVREKQLSSRGLTAYTQHPLLRSVELDRTFYEPISARAYSQFAAQVPDDFRFVAKAHADCTLVQFPPFPRYGSRAGQRNPRLLDVGYATDQVVRPFVEGLGNKAGVLVFQFSPFAVKSPQRFAEKLFNFLVQLPKGPTYAVELRNRELLTDVYGQALCSAHTIHSHNAWGKMPSVLEQRDRLPSATRRILLARWLTRPNDTHEAARQRYLPFDRLVEEDEIRRDDFAKLVQQSLPEATESFLLVSNKAEGCAPQSVQLLAEAIGATL